MVMASISFNLNGKKRIFEGDESILLIDYLRDMEGITSVKDGCSGQGACGACLVELNQKPVLSCRTRMKKVNQASVITIEGFDPYLKETLGRAFVEKGAVQCGFCTPGFLTRTKILLENNPEPTRAETIKALGLNLCRCTGYIKILDAIQYAAEKIQKQETITLPNIAGIGKPLPIYDGYQKAIGQSNFIDDMKIEGILFGALKFSEYPRAKIVSINIKVAEALKGVHRVFTVKDIPGDRTTGMIYKDWPLMLGEGEDTRYIGDVLAGVVADTDAIAREAINLIQIEYQELEPLTDILIAESSEIKVHKDGNLLAETNIKRGGSIDELLVTSAFSVSGTYNTQFVEHAFLETEACIAHPWNKGLKIYTQSQGIYDDRESIAGILNLPEQLLDVILIPSGGAFGGKEDLTVQGHAALFAYLLQKPVKVKLNREESLRMHPKRHPFHMEYSLACDENGKLTALKAVILGDTGAYASMGASVLDRAAGHAGGGYHIPAVNVTSKAFYTNNIPCGAMRGFGVSQVTFAMECLMDELCELGKFDSWQFRYDNALEDGSLTTTGHQLEGGVGLKETMLAVKDDFESAKYAGMAIGIKNVGFGNGLVDESEVEIEIKAENEVVIHHGWTEMGQGIDTVAIQLFCEETGINRPEIVSVKHSTTSEVIAGATTASRGTFLLGNSVIAACQPLKEELKNKPLKALAGKSFRGIWRSDWTSSPDDTDHPVTHIAYGYATQVVILNEDGTLKKVIAAHDVGKAINPLLLEGQVEGGVTMGLGGTYTEKLPLANGQLTSTRLGKLGLLKAKHIPEIEVKIIETADPHGPFGAKGIGEIGLVPTAPAVANALYQFDKKRRYKLPFLEDKL
jgi:aldehyde oxidoreductase